MSDKSLDETTHYQVLARKHRPSTFSELVGQDVMVKVLENSFSSQRIAHAFMLTGVRGVGKTTTARIIAKGLNCVGLDGQSAFAVSPCGQCTNCEAIAKGNHVDVLEFDAASRTGVADIREIIESVYYRAASARFKIYVIDEVHMLSTSAFNALLKTLEEPPKHVKFIFATTEINKVPATVLSRCQRFDLRRIEPETMVDYLTDISVKEGYSMSSACLGQIARASEGSMRDALSLLEQVFVDTNENISVESVRKILGLADRGRLIDLFETLIGGKIESALDQYNNLYNDGADPLNLLGELCEITHWITLFKLSPKLSKDVTMSPNERSRGTLLSEKLDIRELVRLWQLLVKILDESSKALNVKISVEMGLIRVAYAADGPTPDELIQKLAKSETTLSGQTKDNPTVQPESLNQPSVKLEEANTLHEYREVHDIMESLPEVFEEKSGVAGKLNKSLKNFNDVVELIKLSRDLELLIEIENNLRLVNYQIGRIEFQPTSGAAENLASRLITFLKEQTGTRWIVSVVSAGGGKTLSEEREASNMMLEDQAMLNPIVRAVFDNFPESKFYKIEESQNENDRLSVASNIDTEVRS